MKARRITLVWSYESLFCAVAQAFAAGHIAVVEDWRYAQLAWRRAVLAGVDAIVLSRGQPMIGRELDADSFPSYVRASTDAIWKAMKDV